MHEDIRNIKAERYALYISVIFLLNDNMKVKLLIFYNFKLINLI